MKKETKSQQDTQLALTSEQSKPEIIHSPTPEMLISQGIDKGIGVDQLEKLMALQERYLDRQARISFFNALSKFQHECPSLQKIKGVDFITKDGGRVNYKYIPLAEIQNQIREPLHKSGLSFRWEIQDHNAALGVTCILTHIEGHSERTTMTANADDSGKKNAIQSRGSTITYLQRYTLINALGISSADVDNDGAKSGKEQTTRGHGPKATSNQLKELLSRISAGTATIEQALKNLSFDESQLKTLEIAEKNAKQKKEDPKPTQP